MGTERTEVEVPIESSKGRYEDFRRGLTLAGDCGSTFEKPPWFVPELYEHGRKVLWDNLFVALWCHLAGLIIGVTSFKPYTVLLNNGNHFSLRALACRYVSTTRAVLSWYRSDVFDPRSEGHKSVRRVRAMHLAADRYMQKLEPLENGEQWISQYWMGATQTAFIQLMITHPEKLGLRHLSDKDLESIIHYWRCIGYLLGISDDFNVCSGSLDEFRKFTEELIRHEVHPSMLTAHKGQMKLSESIIEALLAVAPSRYIKLTYPAFIAFFAQVLGVHYDRELKRKDRFCLWILTTLFEGRILSYRVMRWLIRKRILDRLDTASKADTSKICDELIDDLDSKEAPSCPFVRKNKIVSIEVSPPRGELLLESSRPRESGAGALRYRRKLIGRVR
ncbi:uncharacterized protein LOC114828481 [Galendromus occidentalis]|uniref:Uncharacterized protein LOC114828481 n=1 Tax=Galendromus occidentalis TaxID=34638 RepID=A0AAJ7SH86_9ACAR|nr:uncharacterized protein LOC114828481 [Galendromus occidentalis]